MILEHLLVGSEDCGTQKTACGQSVEKLRTGNYVVGRNGLNTAQGYEGYLQARLKVRVCLRCDRCLRNWRPKVPPLPEVTP